MGGGIPSLAKILEHKYESNRDKKRNSYFETIDERLFAECCTHKNILEERYSACLKIVDEQR